MRCVQGKQRRGEEEENDMIDSIGSESRKSRKRLQNLGCHLLQNRLVLALSSKGSCKRTHARGRPLVIDYTMDEHVAQRLSLCYRTTPHDLEVVAELAPIPGDAVREVPAIVVVAC
ncbi:hypothetical protein B296_00040249 [Ensete ventricosum]|uniref:Uncharacterized protein n=1 Tax=Ensete ventricosum TaxID=4639 RepID=A0A426ZR46_ENSVE|nr:hypothetical protein B296_00040249 [Ensete ventricosum]